MNTPTTVSPRGRAQGASIVTVLVAIAIIVGIAVAAWFLIIQPHRAAMQIDQPAVQVGKQKAKASAPPPVNVSAMSTSELLAEANKAIKDQRLLAPAGNNAFEFYLKVLQRQPNNAAAKEALRETFPIAANAAEQVINQGDFTEAQREIGLLAQAAPDNYTLTILRAKLDAQRKVQAQQQQAAQLAAQQKVQKAKADALAKQKQVAEAKAQLAQQQAAAQAAKQQNAEALAQAPAQPAAAPKVVIKDAVLVRRVQPDYPPAARRMRRQGWVIVQFTVGIDGRVSDAHVVDSQPHHVFDRAAVRAVSRWEYKPALRNGRPMPVVKQQRIVFTLGNS
ncbi:MAG TPA: energy transducer TonB [Rhodanobacteraceae bacterium]